MGNIQRGTSRWLTPYQMESFSALIDEIRYGEPGSIALGPARMSRSLAVGDIVAIAHHIDGDHVYPIAIMPSLDTTMYVELIDETGHGISEIRTTNGVVIDQTTVFDDSVIEAAQRILKNNE